MNTLTTRRNHLIAARFYALAAAARRAALENDVALIEQGIVIPVYCRIDTTAARYYADQARRMRERAAVAAARTVYAIRSAAIR